MIDHDRSRTYTATNLKAARIAAGYRSASAAAAAFGWSANTLRGHESGSRSISQTDAKKYASAFGVNPDRLFTTSPRKLDTDVERHLEKLIEREASKAKNRRKETADRLVFARMVRGFPTMNSAASYLGQASGTVSNHERGENKISERLAEAYCLAYDIRTDWLLRGELPSGLGQQVDNALERGRISLSRLGHQFLGAAGIPKQADRTRIRSLFDSATARPAAKDESSERIYEIDATDPAAMRDGADNESPRRTWQLPVGLTSSLLAARPEDVFVIAVPRGFPNWELGDRLFVDRSKRDVSVGGMFVYFSGEHGLVFRRHERGSSPLGSDLLGKVVASFVSHVDESLELSESRWRLWESLRHPDRDRR